MKQLKYSKPYIKQMIIFLLNTQLSCLRMFAVIIAMVFFGDMTICFSEELENINDSSISIVNSAEELSSQPKYESSSQNWNWESSLPIWLPLLGGFVILYFQNSANRKNNDRQFLLQKHQADSRSYVPVLLEILRDLNILHSFLIYKGKFCPIIEHRIPVFSIEDPAFINTSSSNNIHAMSVAQRGHQFFSVGLKIIDRCKKIIFLVKDEELSETKKQCLKIQNELFNKTEGKKTKLERMGIDIQSYLMEMITEPNASRQVYSDVFTENACMILDFYHKLEAAIARELPYLGSKHIKY